MPQISVVVPIYNTEKYLPACLDSLLSQTEKDMEILAVDNGCTDGCAGILDKYAAKDRRVRVISKPHGEIYTARNTALRVAAGEWITFCDSDDTLPINAYEHMLKKAKKTSCDVVVGGYVEVDERTGKMPTTLPHKGKNDFGILMYTPCVWNKLIRREFLAAHELEFPPVPIEDVVFLERLLLCNPSIVRVNKPIYYYWQHYSGEVVSLSYRYTIDNFKALVRSHRMIYDETRGTKYQADAEKCVFFSLALSLKDFIPKIWDSDDRQVCFELFRKHVLAFDWSKHEDRFLQYFEVPLSQFKLMSAKTYVGQITALSHRKFVLAEYRAGTIGFQYILAYFKEWLAYKIKKSRGQA